MKRILILLVLVLMTANVSADLTIDQTLKSDQDVYHYLEIIAGGDVYTNGVQVEYTGETVVKYQGDYDPMSPLNKMIDLFEEDSPDTLEHEERNFMTGFLKFMTYLFDYFNQDDKERIAELEFEVMALQLLFSHEQICASSLVTANYYNMTEFTCKSGQNYYNDGNGGWMTIN